MATPSILAQIRRLRKDRGLSQVDMASSLHVALKTYQNIESGATRIDIDRLQHIADVLETDLASLMGIARSDGGTTQQTTQVKDLYLRIIREKEAYITQLEESVRFYREILRERMSS